MLCAPYQTGSYRLHAIELKSISREHWKVRSNGKQRNQPRIMIAQNWWRLRHLMDCNAILQQTSFSSWLNELARSPIFPWHSRAFIWSIICFHGNAAARRPVNFSWMAGTVASCNRGMFNWQTVFCKYWALFMDSTPSIYALYDSPLLIFGAPVTGRYLFERLCRTRYTLSIHSVIPWNPTVPSSQLPDYFVLSALMLSVAN